MSSEGSARKSHIGQHSHSSLSRQSAIRLQAQTAHNSETSVDMSSEAGGPPLFLELNVEPLNPCGCVYFNKRGEVAKFWAYFNLVLVLMHSCYKMWTTVMFSGAAYIYLRAYAVVYGVYFYHFLVSFCSKTNSKIYKEKLSRGGFCFDLISQLFHLVGSILFLLAAGEFKEFKAQRRLLARLYIGSIIVHMVGSYVPQTLFWFYDGHCIPPGGMSLCEGNKTGTVEINPTYKNTVTCFPLTHTYFIIVYFSSTVCMFLWWIYGILMAHSYLFWVKKMKQQEEEEADQIRKSRVARKSKRNFKSVSTVPGELLIKGTSPEGKSKAEAPAKKSLPKGTTSPKTTSPPPQKNNNLQKVGAAAAVPAAEELPQRSTSPPPPSEPTKKEISSAEELKTSSSMQIPTLTPPVTTDLGRKSPRHSAGSVQSFKRSSLPDTQKSALASFFSRGKTPTKRSTLDTPKNTSNVKKNKAGSIPKSY